MNRKIASLFLLFLYLFTACSNTVQEIPIEQLHHNDGFQYAGLSWGSTTTAVEQHLGLSLGESLDYEDGVSRYTISNRFAYRGTPADMELEFFNVQLYEIRFVFHPNDKDKQDLHALYQELGSELKKTYGEPNQDMQDNTGNVLGITRKTDFYLWESEPTKTMQLTKVQKNDVLDSVFLFLGNIEFSSRYEEWQNK